MSAVTAIDAWTVLVDGLDTGSPGQDHLRFR